VRPSSKRGTGGPSCGDSVRTDVGSNSTDSCIGYLPFPVFRPPFWLAVGYPRTTRVKRMSAEVCLPVKRGTTRDGTEEAIGEGMPHASAGVEREA
jgi:hypothetical protein